MAKNISLNDAITEFLLSRKSMGLSENTLKGDRSSLMQLLTTTGNINVKSIEPRHIDALFAGKPDLKVSTRNMLLTRVRVFFDWCMGRNYTNQDPTREVRRGRDNTDNRLFVPLDRFDELLEATANPRDRMVVALGLYLFLRASEVSTLRVGDVDLEAGEIRVAIHKTRDSDVMPICQELDEELRRWLSWYAGNIDEPLSDEMYLVPQSQNFRAVPGPEAGRFIVTEGVTTRVKPFAPITRPWEPVKKALSSLGYPTKREGGHTLRRSGARALFETIRGTDGMDGALQQVKVMLHHKNVAMTEHYLGIAPERIARDSRLKGRPMFARRATAGDNVVELRRT